MSISDEFHVYDTTLRDGAQQEGLALSVADKIAIAQHLDDLGVGFIEGGWPGAVPKDTEFFERARTELHLKNATFAAFGATRKPGPTAADDPQVAALRDSGAGVVTLVAKSHDAHVERALRTTLDENLRDGRRHRPPPARARPAGLPRHRALLRRLPREPCVRARSRPSSRRGRRRRRRPVRHQRRHAARELQDIVRDVLDSTGAAARHPLSQRRRLRGGELDRRRRGRRHARPGHDQRVRRTHRQRRPARDRRQPRAQAGAGTAPGRQARRVVPGSPTRSPK